jgi:hypothetical protein
VHEVDVAPVKAFELGSAQALAIENPVREPAVNGYGSALHEFGALAP